MRERQAEVRSGRLLLAWVSAPVITRRETVTARAFFSLGDTGNPPEVDRIETRVARP